MPKKIAVIGAGFSGTMVVRQLMDQGFNGIIELFQSNQSIGLGPAYSEQNPELLLNVRSANMSAFPDEKDHFLHFLQEHFPEHADPSSFCPRYIYGKYLKCLWTETLHRTTKIPVTLVVREDAFVDSTDYSHIVLATGNELPRISKVISESVQHSSLFLANPWNNQLPILDSEDPIFILGNGLTMVDTVLNLRKSGATQQIIALSRHGFQILSHPQVKNAPRNIVLPNKTSLLELLTYFNKKRKSESLEEFLGRIDACRPAIAAWWQGFSKAEKHFFLKHLRHRWGTVRHRIPTEIAQQITLEEASGKLLVLAGKLIEADLQEGKITVRYAAQGKERTIQCALFINCTGPETSIAHMFNPTIQDFLAKKWILPDEVQQGIHIDPTRHVALGKSSIPIYAIGNLCKGTFWESTAIGELRSQAKLIAKDILEH